MSIVALLNESIPHILASLVTHLMATSWAAFQITHTAKFRADFNRVITNGACDGVSLLPNYWRDRGSAEIPSLALNVFALLISSFLTWRLIKVNFFILFSAINLLRLGPWLVVRMADFQTCWGILDNQQNLQDRSRHVHHHTTLFLFCRCYRFFVDRSVVE